jgi:hypothetical protein
MTEADDQLYAYDPDADCSMNVRARGEGIEGRPIVSTARSSRYASRRYTPKAPPSTQAGGLRDDHHDDDEGQSEGLGEEDTVLVHNRKIKTTLALLQTLHAQTRFWVSRLAALLPTPGEGDTTVQLAPRDVLELELGPLSTLDAHFIEWLAKEYGAGVQVTVRRGWRDILGLVFTIGGGASAPSL